MSRISSPKRAALSGQKTVESTSDARENQRPAKLGLCLDGTGPEQNLAFTEPWAKSQRKQWGDPQPLEASPLPPAPLQTSSSDSLLRRERPGRKQSRSAWEKLYGRTSNRSWSPGRKNTTEITTVGNGAALQGPGVYGEWRAGRTARERGTGSATPRSQLPGHGWTKGLLRQAWDCGPSATTGPGVIKMLWGE